MAGKSGHLWIKRSGVLENINILRKFPICMLFIYNRVAYNSFVKVLVGIKIKAW